MNKIVCSTDPISLKDLPDVTGLPSNIDVGAETSVTVYFESEANRRAFMDIPVEHPTGELSVNLDNPAGEYIDEG